MKNRYGLTKYLYGHDKTICAAMRRSTRLHRAFCRQRGSALVVTPPKSPKRKVENANAALRRALFVLAQ